MPSQVFCDVTDLDARSIDDLLTHAVSLDVEDNMYFFKMDGVTEKVSVTNLTQIQIRVLKTC
jgi:hypothetical protein